MPTPQSHPKKDLLYPTIASVPENLSTTKAGTAATRLLDIVNAVLARKCSVNPDVNLDKKDRTGRSKS